VTRLSAISSGLIGLTPMDVRRFVRSAQKKSTGEMAMFKGLPDNWLVVLNWGQLQHIMGLVATDPNEAYHYLYEIQEKTIQDTKENDDAED
jgi:hypothetical protein